MSLAALTLLNGVHPDQGLDAISALIENITALALLAAGALAIIFIIIGGIRFATSAGDPARLKSAKETLLYAVGGLVLTLVAGAIINTIYSVLLPKG